MTMQCVGTARQSECCLWNEAMRDGGRMAMMCWLVGWWRSWSCGAVEFGFAGAGRAEELELELARDLPSDQVKLVKQDPTAFQLRGGE